MFGLAVSGAAVAATIGLGIALKGKKVRGSKKVFVVTMVVSVMMLLTGAILSLASGTAVAAEAAEAAGSGLGLGLVAMALATGLACIGAGIAVGSVGSAALGLVGEKPEMLGITLLYVGLAEGVAIYGIVISMLVMGKL